MARKVFLISRALSKQTPDEPIEAVVIVWDMDAQGDQRREGVAIARDDARGWVPFRIVYGLPEPEREAWVLAGFEPRDDAERALLDEVHRALGFSPVLQAIQLRDPDDGASRSIKRVLRALTGGAPGREERCWTEPALDTLRDRGGETGLAAFLAEIEEHVLPLLSGASG